MINTLSIASNIRIKGLKYHLGEGWTFYYDKKNCVLKSLENDNENLDLQTNHDFECTRSRV